MVIATEICALSEYRIYPGNGLLMIRRDCKPVFLGSSKAKSLTLQRKKPAKLVWTQAWRRLHKKGLSETTTKKRTRRTTKIQRAVVGISLDEIKKRAAQKPEYRSAQRLAAVKEAKEKAKAQKKSSGRGDGSNRSSTLNKASKKFSGKGNRGSQR